MPPKKSGKPLSPDQIAVLRRWVSRGALVDALGVRPAQNDPRCPPSRTPAGPSLRSIASSWPGSRPKGSGPHREAGKTTLIRRVTLDLTGLPPTLREVDAFLADSSPQAYEKVVDRLLDSPRYGEHMARFWLDAARYGDTHGLHLDNYREAWPYRDWVIHAFNANKPFDRFIVEQLAGDLLPNATPDQIIATGYNRCHVSTNEGGSIEEEVYVRNIVDQVDTNGTVFLGLTTGCARCHDHKYDPIRTKDYYQLFAFFNNIDGPAMDGNAARWAPIAQVPTPAQAEGARTRPTPRSPSCARPSPRQAASAVAGVRPQGRCRPARSSAPGRLRLDRRRPAHRGHARGRRSLELRRQARPPGLERLQVAAQLGARGSISGSSTTPGASSRSAPATRCLLMFTSIRTTSPGS